MTVVPLLAGLAVALCLVMMAAWAVAERTGNSGWVDTIWSFGVGAAGVAAALVPLGAASFSGRQLFVALLAALWSVRLGLHILARTLQGKDDPRYAQLRKEWGAHASFKSFWFLQIQAACAFVLVVAIFMAARNPSPLVRPGDWLGVLVLVIALVGEAIADRQLAAFRAQPANKGRVCDAGLWGLTRHPNYFFEWLGWCAYPLIAMDFSGAYPQGFLALMGPLLIYWLLVYASGIPPTEAHMLRSRGEAFRAYQKRVNAFWPGPGRKGG